MPNFTEKAIKQAFLKLLEEQPLAQISVKDIVEECGINRNSFYYHFSGIPALIEVIIKEYFDALIGKYPGITSAGECFEEAIRYALENKKALLHIYKSLNREVFEKHLMFFCEYAVTAYISAAFRPTASEGDRKMIIHFLKCTLFGIYIDWMNSGMPEEALEEVDRMLTVCDGIPEKIISRLTDCDR